MEDGDRGRGGDPLPRGDPRCGLLHHPATPQLGGEAAFSGETVHTARWDNSIDFSNKVIHVI